MNGFVPTSLMSNIFGKSYEYRAKYNKYKDFGEEEQTMTCKEAIEQLKSLRADVLDYAEFNHREGDYDTVFDKDVEALDMAIAALDKPPLDRTITVRITFCR